MNPSVDRNLIKTKKYMRQYGEKKKEIIRHYELNVITFSF